MIFAEEASMQGQNLGDTLTDLSDAAAIQDEFVQHRLAIEWAKTLLDRLLCNWMLLETYEGIAYEDKVKTQVTLVNAALTSLSHLQKTLSRFRHQLKDHHRRLTRRNDPAELS